MPITIALVEDNETLRRRFIERFRFFDDVELVLAAGSGEAFLGRLRELSTDRHPQVVLMDIELPGISGIVTTARLKEAWPDIEVMMLTVFEDEDRIFDSIRAGASGYLLKDATTDAIVGAVLSLMKGGAPISPAVARKMLGYVRSGDGEAPRPQDGEPSATFELSDRELEILQLVVQDDLETVIADRLHISPHTVRTHIKNIYKKLHVHSRASAVRVAFEHNLLR
jgi:DNA-binding NarL/FixJ family response regulator